MDKLKCSFHGSADENDQDGANEKPTSMIIRQALDRAELARQGYLPTRQFPTVRANYVPSKRGNNCMDGFFEHIGLNRAQRKIVTA